MNIYEPNDAVHRLGASVHKLVRPLEAISLVAEKDAAKAEKLMAVADEALETARHHEEARHSKATEAAERLIDAGKVSIEALHAEAVTFAAGDDVAAIANKTYVEAIRRAREIAFARVGEAPAVITARFDEIRGEVERNSDVLAGVKNAQQAIDRDLTAEWQAITQLQGEYEALTALVDQLKSFGLIPTPRPSESGSHWRFRLDADPFDKATDDRGRFLVAIRRHPYVAASNDEALAVGKSWHAEDAA